MASAAEQLSRLRLKYGWHNCWRTTRDGLRITHWREQCGPEVWPRAE